MVKLIFAVFGRDDKVRGELRAIVAVDLIQQMI